MKRSIKVYNKIPEASSFKVAPFDSRKKRTQPHRHNNYFEIIYLSSCEGIHWIDSIKYEAKPPVVYFLQKDVIHHWELEGEVQGYVIIIKNKFVEAIKDGVLRSLFITLHAFKCLYLPHNAGLSHLFNVLEDSSKSLSRGYYNENIIEGLLKVILAKMLELGNFPSIKSHQQDLFLQYTSLLSNPNIGHRTIATYADALHTSSQNLNNVCRKVADKSASEILADYIINEAKRWLNYSDLNITEISFKLEFQDPSYFIKYFKRQTGHTPEEYRSLHTKIDRS